MLAEEGYSMEEIARGSWIFKAVVCFIEATSKLEDSPSFWIRAHDPVSILVQESTYSLLAS